LNTLDQESDNRYGIDSNKYDLQSQRHRDYSHLYDMIEKKILTQ